MVRELFLPRSQRSQSDHYLTGCNAPGIFRISGTATTINALFHFFDHQFPDAGSPSKVEETVGTGLLPSEIEFSLHDIASLFKKIINGFPGGLIGSLEIFEAFRSVLLDWHADPKISGTEVKEMRAKIVALAILSIPSLHRVHLIQAVLGLTAYFGYEAEKARTAERIAAGSQESNNDLYSEIMNYQSLGKVLGPLLLGDLTDSVDVGGSSSLASRISAEHPQEELKKSKNQKRNSVPSKIEKDATLSAHVERANLTAQVMHLLLVEWNEVVKQLGTLHDAGGPSSQPNESTHLSQKTPTQTASSLTLKSSDEEMQFLDILRGRKLPQEFRGAVKVKRKVRITSRSPMARGAIHASEDSSPSHKWLPGTIERQGAGSPARSNAAESSTTQNSGLGIKLAISHSANHPVSFTEDIPSIERQQRTESDLAMDEMAMGTILTPRKGSSVYSNQKPLSHHSSPMGTPLGDSHTIASSYIPETAVRLVPTLAQRRASIRRVQAPSINKPLPLIGDAQKAQYTNLPDGLVEPEAERQPHERLSLSHGSGHSRTSTESSPWITRQPIPRTLFPSHESEKSTPTQMPQKEEEDTYPPRQSSLHQEPPLGLRSIDPIPTFGSLAEYKAWSNAESNSPNERPQPHKTSEGLIGRYETSSEAKRNDSDNLASSSVEFTKASGISHNDEQTPHDVENSDLTKVYAYIHPLHQPKFSFEDPFISSAELSPGRDTLIPKPTRDVGRCRKAASESPRRSPSPPKRAAPPAPKDYTEKRGSIYNIIPDKDAEIVRANGKAELESAGDAPTTRLKGLSIESDHTNPSDELPSRNSETLPSRPGSPEKKHHLYSAESEYQRNSHSRVYSIARSLSPSQSEAPTNAVGYLTPSSPSRVNSFRNASDALKKLERHGSLNATLYQEIMRLQRLLEQRGEEVQAAKRSLDVVREARDATPAKAGQRSSWGKSTWNEEDREAKRQLSVWKKRAEEAESRLANLEGLSENFDQRHDTDMDDSMNHREMEMEKKWATSGRGISVEVLVDRKGDEQV